MVGDNAGVDDIMDEAEAAILIWYGLEGGNKDKRIVQNGGIGS